MPGTKEDLTSIQADVASFVSSLGFSGASADGGGFYDQDFRKKGPISDKRPHKGKENAQGISDNSKLSSSSFSSKQAKLQFTEDEKSKASDKRKKERKKKPRAEKTTGSGAQEEDKRSIYKLGGSKTTHLNSFGYDEKRQVSEVEKNGRTEATLDSATHSSNTFFKVYSLIRSGPWYKATLSLLDGWDHAGALESEGKTKCKAVDGESQRALIVKARKKGEELIQKVATEYEKSRGKDSDMRWLMIARKTGTTADKVAAFTVLLQDNAVANLKSLDALLGMVTSKGGKRHAAMGIDALKELFVTSLLPDWKLKYLTQRPLQEQLVATPDGEGLLFLWFWEDCLKQKYEQFVSSLEEATKDKLPFLKEKAVKTLYELLKSKPEQERKLLSALVNKLGDPDRKVASNAGYYLSCLLSVHPNMKMVVVQEVDFFLFRPHLGMRSRYQAVIFLNQIVLSNRGDGPKLAKRLIDIYFSLFKVITAGESRNQEESPRSNGGRKGHKKEEDKDVTTVEMDSRLLSELLTGVNRAFPYVSAEEVNTLIEEHTPVLFRLVHSTSFNVGVQALMLLFQLLARNNTVSDRLYRALYAVLLSPALPKSTKVEMFLGLVFKAIKLDINSKRMAAFSKRLMQVALQGAPEFACGCLLLLSEILKSRPTLWRAITQPEDANEDVEHFKDLEDVNIGDNDTDFPSQESPTGDEISNDAAQDGVLSSEFVGWPQEGYYNSRHRDPTFCNADQACLWELTALASHAHPSVAAMAKTLLSGASILYAGDPLKELAFRVFLDRFVEKKPKPRHQSKLWHGSSLSGPTKKAATLTSLPFGAEFLKLSEKEVAPEDVVFHKFYNSRQERKHKSGKFANTKDDSIAVVGEEDELVNDESDEDEIDDLLDQEEGEEMGGLDDHLSDDDNESEGEWTYYQADGYVENDNANPSSSDEENMELGDIDEIYHSSEDEMVSEDLDEHSFEDSVQVSTRDAKSQPRKQAKSKKKGKKAKGKSAIMTMEGSSKSPFASLDEYSHLLEVKMPKGDTAGKGQKKRKRAK